MKNKLIILFIALLVFSQYLKSFSQPIAAGVASQTVSSGLYQTSKIDMAGNGKFDVAFSMSSPGYYQCFERSYNSNATPVFGSEQLVFNNSVSQKSDDAPVVAMNDNGTYIVVYMENNVSNVLATNYSSIYFQKYNANGTQNGNRVFVDYGMFPDVDMADDGTFNIVYQSGHSFSNPSVYVMRFNASYTQAGPRITVSGGYGQNRKGVIKSQNGNKCVVSFYGTSYGISQIKRYSTIGVQIGSTITLAGHQDIPTDFIVKPNDDLVVLGSEFINPNTRNYYIIHYANGSVTPVSSVLHLTAAADLYWSIGANSAGNYVICYYNNQARPYGPLVVQEFSVNDAKVGPEYAVKDDLSGNGAVFTPRMPNVTVSGCRYGVSFFGMNSSNLMRIGWETFTLAGATNSANAGPDKSVTTSCCTGCNQTTIGTAAIPGCTYSWSPTTYMTPSNGLSAVEGITHPGTGASFFIDYTVTVTSPDGCAGTDVARVSFAACRMGSDGESNEMSISPNPSDGLFNIEWVSENNSVAKLEIVDAIGKTVYSSNEIYPNQKMQLDLSSLPKGIYLCQLYNTEDNQKLIKKMIIF